MSKKHRKNPTDTRSSNEEEQKKEQKMNSVKFREELHGSTTYDRSDFDLQFMSRESCTIPKKVAVKDIKNVKPVSILYREKNNIILIFRHQ